MASKMRRGIKECAKRAQEEGSHLLEKAVAAGSVATGKFGALPINTNSVNGDVEDAAAATEQQKIERLCCALNFSPAAARHALRRCGGSIQDAGIWLLEEANAAELQALEMSARQAGRLQPGCTARLCGLKGPANLNGAFVTLLRFEEDAQRWIVQMADGSHKAIRRKNLDLVAGVTSSAATSIGRSAPGAGVGRPAAPTAAPAAAACATLPSQMTEEELRLRLLEILGTTSSETAAALEALSGEELIETIASLVDGVSVNTEAGLPEARLPESLSLPRATNCPATAGAPRPWAPLSEEPAPVLLRAEEAEIAALEAALQAVRQRDEQRLRETELFEAREAELLGEQRRWRAEAEAKAAQIRALEERFAAMQQGADAQLEHESQEQVGRPRPGSQGEERDGLQAASEAASEGLQQARPASQGVRAAERALPEEDEGLREARERGVAEWRAEAPGRPRPREEAAGAGAEAEERDEAAEETARRAEQRGVEEAARRPAAEEQQRRLEEESRNLAEQRRELEELRAKTESAAKDVALAQEDMKRAVAEQELFQLQERGELVAKEREEQLREESRKLTEQRAEVERLQAQSERVAEELELAREMLRREAAEAAELARERGLQECSERAAREGEEARKLSEQREELERLKAKTERATKALEERQEEVARAAEDQELKLRARAEQLARDFEEQQEAMKQTAQERELRLLEEESVQRRLGRVLQEEQSRLDQQRRSVLLLQKSLLDSSMLQPQDLCVQMRLDDTQCAAETLHPEHVAINCTAAPVRSSAHDLAEPDDEEEDEVWDLDWNSVGRDSAAGGGEPMTPHQEGECASTATSSTVSTKEA